MGVNIDPKSKKLNIRFSVPGYSKQFYLSSGLKNTKANKAIVDSRWELIQREISLGVFDASLERYRFGLKKTNKPPKPKINLAELWDKFTDYQQSQIAETTILNRYKAVSRYIRRLPTHSLGEAIPIRDWLLKNTTPKMASLLINHFNQCCDWGVVSEVIDDNPFTKLKFKENKNNISKGDYRAFTLEQRDIIISAFEQHSKYSHYAPLIKFLFLTGCRHGEAFALTWSDVSLDCCQISINKSKNLYRIMKSTKNGVERIFPTKKDSKLQIMLQNIKPHSPQHGQLVFPDKAGNPLSSPTLQKIWKGYSVNSYYYPGVVSDLVVQEKIPYYLKAYATRHTFATWAITTGVSPDKVALWIGDRAETVLRYYSHPDVVKDSCPDF
jgi:integrase